MDDKLITKEAVKQVIFDYWQELKAYPWQTSIGIISPGIGNILIDYIPPLILARLIDTFTKNQQVSFSTSVSYIFLFALAWLIGEIFWRVGLHFVIKVKEKGINTLAKRAFLLLLNRDHDFYAKNFVGTLTKKAAAYSKNFETVVDTICFDVFSEVTPMIFVFIVLWRYSPWIPLILVTCLGALVFIAVPIVKKRIKLVTQGHDAQSKMIGRLADNLTNILAIKSFSGENHEYVVYGRHVDRYTHKLKESSDYHNLRYETVITPLYVFTNVIGLVSAIFFAQTLGLRAGAVIVVFSYYSQISRVFWNISKIYRNMESSISEAAEFTQLLIDPPVVQDKKGATHLEIGEGKIVFSKVNFNYAQCKKGEDCFISDFNLEIKNKQKVGLVGPSGGGKTTITKLLLRFVDPEFGDILIDGQRIGDVNQASLREVISYVPQEPLLFHRSLYENIAYGHEGATEKDVVESAKLAHADEFIRQLPEGYETLVGERGIKLSGGQRQRVAIARALLKNAPILVLDEATSALDSESEKYIQEGLWELMKDKTALVIAHRLSTIKHLDRILVLDQGRIIQDGTHDELIGQEGLYAKLWSHQAGKAEELV